MSGRDTLAKFFEEGRKWKEILDKSKKMKSSLDPILSKSTKYEFNDVGNAVPSSALNDDDKIKNICIITGSYVSSAIDLNKSNNASSSLYTNSTFSVVESRYSYFPLWVGKERNIKENAPMSYIFSAWRSDKRQQMSVVLRELLTWRNKLSVNNIFKLSVLVQHSNNKVERITVPCDLICCGFYNIDGDIEKLQSPLFVQVGVYGSSNSVRRNVNKEENGGYTNNAVLDGIAHTGYFYLTGEIELDDSDSISAFSVSSLNFYDNNFGMFDNCISLL